MYCPTRLSFLFLTIHLILTAAQSPSCPHVTTCLQKLRSGQNQCDLFPMPPGSILPPIRPLGYNVTQVRQGVHLYHDGLYQALLIYSKQANHLIAIDFPRSKSSLAPDGFYLLIRATREILKGDSPKRISMVYSHFHTDHIGEAFRYRGFIDNAFPKASVDVWGTQETFDFINGNRDVNLPIPTKIIGNNRVSFQLEPKLRVELSILGGHTNSDLLAYIPPLGSHKGVAYFADIITPRSAPFIGFGVTVDLKQYMMSHMELLKLDFDVFLAGHGRIGDKQDIRTNLQYTKSVVDAIILADKQLDPRIVRDIIRRAMDPADAAFGNVPFTVTALSNVRVENCRRNIIKQWGCKLAAVDLYAHSHCLAARVFVVTNLK